MAPVRGKLKLDSKEASDPTYTLKKFLSNAPNESELEHEDDDQNGALQEMSWEEQLQRLFTDLRASSTKTRQHALSGIALSCPQHSQKQRMELLRVLASSITRFNDKRSVQLGLDALRQLCLTRDSDEKPGAIPAAAAQWVISETEKTLKGSSQGLTTAATTRSVLLHWCNTVTNITSSIPNWQALVSTQATLFTSILESKTKSSVQQSAIVNTRRAVRNNPEAISQWLKALVTVSPKPQHAPLIGLVVGVALRLRAKDFAPGKPRNGEGKTMVEQIKADILSFYTSILLSAKNASSEPIVAALDEFIQIFLTADDLKPVQSQMDKMCLRSPEIILPFMQHFYTHFSDISALSSSLTTSLDNTIQNLSKSTNAAVRAGAVTLFAALVDRAQPDASQKVVVSTIDFLKSGKSVSADQRAARACMLAAVQPCDQSKAIIDAVITLLPKETNEIALQALMKAFSVHAKGLLSNASIDVAKVLVKGMTDAKPPLRKAVCIGVAEALWEAESVSEAFQDALLPALEINIKNATTTPLTNTAGPLEGYIAVALLQHVLTSPKSAAFRTENPVMASITQVGGVKPSFLYWDKAIKKAETDAEQIWLVRAAARTLLSRQAILEEQEDLPAAELGYPLFHIALNGCSHITRAAALSELAALPTTAPALCLQIVPAAFRQIIQRQADQPHLKLSEDDVSTTNNSTSRLQALLSRLAQASSNSLDDFKTSLAVSVALSAHHPLVDPKGDSLWSQFVQNSNLNVELLVNAQQETLTAAAMEALLIYPSAALGFRDAGRQLLTSLVLISPMAVMPDISDKAITILSASSIDEIREQEIDIYRHSGDQPFVNVLADKKSDAPTKGKGAADRKWDEEVRKSLASKQKGGIPILSKTDQAAVKAQLAKEADVRVLVGASVSSVKQALSIIESMLPSPDEALVEELPAVIEALGAFASKHLAKLVASDVLGLWTALATLCLPGESQLLAAAVNVTLESHRAVIMPDGSVPAISAMATNVLYRLKFLTEFKPLKAHAFAFISNLIFSILSVGGVGVPADDKESSSEQMTLAIEVLAAHCHAASDSIFPRLTMAQSIISCLIQHPQLTRQASTALTTLGEAISANATDAELRTILDGTLAQESHIRLACLQALQHADLTDFSTFAEIWLAKEDEDERNSKLAEVLWVENGLDLPEDFVGLLLTFLEDSRPFVRAVCALSLAPALEEHDGKTGELVQALTKLYHEKNKILMPEYDKFGMVIEETLNREDPWRCRAAIARSFATIAPHLRSNDVLVVFDLLLSGGALGDRSSEVRSQMLSAANKIIEVQGRRDMSALIDVFDSQLGRPESAFGDQFTADRIKEAMVILYGGLARHMESSDPRVSATVERLFEALKTPSEVVQIAASDCLPPLVKLRKDEAPMLIDRLMTQLFAGSKYAERRGAAYGLAGVIKGRGISALKEFNIVGRLKDALEDKKNINARQGALFAVETLSVTLGRIFEPYIIQILPYILSAMGDGQIEVREATQDASKAIMSKVSGHAVKLILPSLLEGLEERQWRSKKGAIEMLGAMANLAPRQLAISLPTIIPRLAEVLTDTHTQVRSAGNASLKRFGEVITNPEIQQIQNIILDALVDPAQKTNRALDSLISTSFAHFIDSSSLALVVPILDRGLRERSSETKRKSAQIVGNMATLTDARDLSPYLGQLTPLVRTVLVDPVPEARATAAKALGGLVERLGEDSFPDLVASLLEVLRTEGSGIDQQGAAQGLAEVLGGLGTERLEDLFPDIVDSTSSPRAHVREGFMSLIVFLPSVFGDRFTPYLNRIISPVLSGLADASDFVRDASMRAGRMIVSSHSQKAVDLLLPELEQSLFDGSWRIRQSSLQLIGELLFRIVGITARTDQLDEEEKEEEAERQTGETSKKALLDVLGKERRDKVLASVYIVRQDASGLVRQLSVHIWKALVQNTPRMIREILPVLVSNLVKALSSPGFEQRETASRTLGELCRRLGDRILDDVLPILKEASNAGVKSREGVCRAYIEIMRNTEEEQLEGHEADIASAIRVLLVDDDEQVRMAAAKAFDTMQQHMGSRAIDETIPTLLNNLDAEGAAADAALSALREMMSVRAAVVVPVLVPALTKQPIPLAHARALTNLVGTAGNAISDRVVIIMSALEKSKQLNEDGATATALDEALEALFASIKDTAGLNSIMMHLLGLAKNADPERRISACILYSTFCQNATTDHSDFDVDFLRQLVPLLDDKSDEVVQAAWKALTALVATLSKEGMESLSVPLRRTIENTGGDQKVPGFCLPNGIKSLMRALFEYTWAQDIDLTTSVIEAIFLQGLLAGTAEQREQSAYGFGDLVERTTPEAIKPFVAQITGPLIRILGERVPAPVKTAILTSLTTLLVHIPALIRPFYPQIQRTFVKNLSDATSSSVRTRAGHGLGALMAHQPRIDPLITELVNGAMQHDESELRDSFASTLPKVIQSGGQNMSQAAREAVVSFLEELYGTPNLKESLTIAAANTLTALGRVEAELVRAIVVREVLEGAVTAKTSITLRSMAASGPEVIEALGISAEVSARVQACIAVPDQPNISRPAREARDVLRL